MLRVPKGVTAYCALHTAYCPLVCVNLRLIILNPLRFTVTNKKASTLQSFARNAGFKLSISLLRQPLILLEGLSTLGQALAKQGLIPGLLVIV